MLPANAPSKVTDVHLQRAAVVYLRQSTEKQVRHNRESRRLQYALKDRATELGFTQVRVIDSDLGSSAGVGAAARAGFDQLVASVAVGEVGMILSREVSRLSRTDKDWARLMEVCQLFGTLIADAEQIYDLNLIDDQLVLGIKGTLSVVELSTLKLRMQAGMAEKARRGVLQPPAARLRPRAQRHGGQEPRPTRCGSARTGVREVCRDPQHPPDVPLVPGEPDRVAGEQGR